MAERTKYGFAVMPGTMVVMVAGHAALMLSASKDVRARSKMNITGLLSGLAGIESGEFAPAIRRNAWFACGCFDRRTK